MLQDHKDKIISLPVAEDMIGSIIGNKGSTIRRIVKEAGGEQAVRIDIDRNNARVTITGTTKEASVRICITDGVIFFCKQCRQQKLNIPIFLFAGCISGWLQAAAKAGILAVIEAELARVIVLDVPDYATGQIIGSGGATIAKIQNDTGCQVQLRRETSKCRITGPDREAMESARVRTLCLSFTYLWLLVFEALP